MKTIDVSNDIIPIGEFKTNLSKWFKNTHNTGHPLIITQNGKPAGVLLSPADYDNLVHMKSFIESINRGINDAKNNRTFTTQELQEELRKRREIRDSVCK